MHQFSQELHFWSEDYEVRHLWGAEMNVQERSRQLRRRATISPHPTRFPKSPKFCAAATHRWQPYKPCISEQTAVKCSRKIFPQEKEAPYFPSCGKTSKTNPITEFLLALFGTKIRHVVCGFYGLLRGGGRNDGPLTTGAPIPVRKFSTFTEKVRRSDFPAT